MMSTLRATTRPQVDLAVLVRFYAVEAFCRHDEAVGSNVAGSVVFALLGS